MNPRNQTGITLVELIVCVGIILFLCSLALPRVGYGLARGPETQLLSNMKQLHLATQQMVLDGATTGNTKFGWPGDTGGTFTNWAALILSEEYMSTNDLCKMLSGPGIVVSPSMLRTMNETAVRVYAVTGGSPGSTVLFTSANFTNTSTGGEPLNSSAKPYGKKGFVVFRKGGDGSILSPSQVGQTNIIGSFVPLCR